MNKINIKKTIVWIIISLLSLALIISNFAINTQQRSNANTKKFNGYTISNADIQSITQSFSTYKKIQRADENLQKLVEKNIEYNTLIKNLNILTTEQALLNEIINIDIFQKQGVFRPDLYHAYLKKTNTTELTFQKKIKFFLEQNSTEHSLKILSHKKVKTKHTPQYLTFKINKNKSLPQAEKYNLHNNIRSFDITYKDINIKNITKNINITKKDLITSKKRNNNKYTKQRLIKINHIFIKKTNNNYKNIKNKIKQKQNINTDIKQLNSKIIWITTSELNENFKKNYINNILLNKTKTGLHIIHRLKTIKGNIYKKHIVNTDIINNYKKFKAIKKIHHEIINYNHDSKIIAQNFNYNTTSLQIRPNYGILSLKLIKPWFLTKKKRLTTSSDLIKINNNRYLILNLSTHKNTDKNQQNHAEIKSYLNKINIEKNILKVILKFKNKKKNYPKYTYLKKHNDDFFYRHSNNGTQKLIKYKNTYFIIK